MVDAQKPMKQVVDYFTEMYSRYSYMLFRICMVHLGNKEDAEEAMQESFLKLIYKRPQFTSREHEKAWLIRVTTNTCRDMLRSVWRKRVVKMEDVESYYDIPSDMHIMQEILKLPGKYKTIIYLYYFEDYSVREISEILKVSESAVKMSLKRGRDILKIELEGDLS